MGTNFFTVVGVLPSELLAHHASFNGLFCKLTEIPYLFGYKPSSAISQDPKLLTEKINLIDTNCKCIILTYKPRPILGLDVYYRLWNFRNLKYKLTLTEKLYSKQSNEHER